MKQQMSPELRQLRKQFPFPVSRLAYARIYEKSKEVMAKLGLDNSMDLLFMMLHKTSRGSDPTALAANCPMLLGVYFCILADVEAARVRSECKNRAMSVHPRR